MPNGAAAGYQQSNRYELSAGTGKWYQQDLSLDLATGQYAGALVSEFLLWPDHHFTGCLDAGDRIPWRKQQGTFRKDFWLDGFYMFFNFFLFAIGLNGIWAMFGQLGRDLHFTAGSLTLVDMSAWPSWAQLLVFFLILDFVQWFTHILLHRIPAFWQFHKVHHSVQEMGFAAHLRYHWMENVLYKPLKTLGVMVIGGFEPEQAYLVHFIA